MFLFFPIFEIRDKKLLKANICEKLSTNMNLLDNGKQKKKKKNKNKIVNKHLSSPPFSGFMLLNL